MIRYHDIKPEQKANNDFLRKAVVGVTCLYAGSVTGAPLTPEQKREVDNVQSFLAKDDYLGTIEVYANGVFNLFAHDGQGEIFGIWKFVPEGIRHEYR